jgi:hypothetical protein
MEKIISELTWKLNRIFAAIEHADKNSEEFMPIFCKQVEEYALENSETLSDAFILYCLL